MKIDPERFYSLLQTQKFTKIKTRQRIADYIKEGNLRAIPVNYRRQKRYAIKGEWIESFIDRYKRGVVQGGKYTKAELINTLECAVGYCKENNITTIEELTNSLKKL